ncbi:hypothetical protein F6455_18255 [Proteobacteria bacterium 005FR1]|nr:hypothetical protein [Proteobacteria bacterium 005FR1]
MDFEEVEAQRVLQSEDDWHKDYMQEFLAIHQRYAEEYFPTCGQYLLAGGYRELELLFVLDASGNVIGLRTRPNVPEALCFVDFFGSFDYPEPGRLFYGKLQISGTVERAAPPLTNRRPPGTSANQDLRKTLTGAWAWNEEQCAADPIRISFSEDGSLMYHRNKKGLYLGDKSSPKERVVYQILAASERGMRTMIEGEDRKTPEGDTVGWDLILLSDDAFCWHRWDWPEECTQPLISCD